MRAPLALTAATCAAVLACGTSACGGGSDKAKGGGGKASPSTTARSSSTVSGGTGASTTASTLPAPIPGCLPTPAGQAMPPWLPKDLPMPDGTTFVEEVRTQSQAHVGRFVVAGTIQQFVRFALAEYPKAGWRLGRGDSEPGEAEDGFARSTEGGAWRVRASLCDTSKSELFVTYASNINATPPPTFATTTTAPPPSSTP